MKYYKKITIIVSILTVTLSVLYAIEAYYQVISIENKVIRLHILANSDTKQDQELKLKVRNNILTEFNGKFSNLTTCQDAQKTIKNNLDKIKDIAQKTVCTEGYYYDVNVFYGNYMFPEKNYGTFTLPKGEYNAVKVVLGQGKGKNWWCVMFPPLCFSNIGKTTQDVIFDIDLEKKLQNILTTEEINLIKNNRGYTNIRLKSRLAEIIKDITNYLHLKN